MNGYLKLDQLITHIEKKCMATIHARPGKTHSIYVGGNHQFVSSKIISKYKKLIMA